LKLVIIANDTDIRQKVAAAIAMVGDESIALTALADLPELLKKVPVSGIIIELATSARANPREKQETNALIQLYPNTKVRWTNDELVFFGQGATFKEFIQDCRSFTPRTVRKAERRIRHIAFLLADNREFEHAEKVVTLNISDGGCFVFSTKDWHVGEKVWLQFADNKSVITGTVRWWQPWGNNKKMPGIGICFD